MRTLQYTGSIGVGALYVPRSADAALLSLLKEGHYCNVLAPRQIGKSSLRVRTAAQLVAEGWRVAQVDLTSYGSSRTPEEWYFGLAEQLARDLGEADPYDLWKTREGLTPAARWSRLIEEWAARATSPIAIFLDEIEAVRLVKFPFDEFFLTIRALSDKRSQSPALARVRFCFLGATSPSNLIQLKTITPFNSTERVRLDDFSLEELLAADKELSIGAPILRDVYDWTAGHPYMTMRVLHAVDTSTGQADVGAIVDRLFLTQPFEDPNLQYAANRFDGGPDRFGARLHDKIELYQRLLVGAVELGVEEAAAQDELWLCGMVKRPQSGAPLKIRNRVFQTVFDDKWLEKRRQRSRIGKALHVWEQFERQDAMLLRGDALREAEDLAKRAPLSTPEQHFIEASQKAEIAAREKERAALEVIAAQYRAKVEAAEARLVAANTHLGAAEAKLAASRRRSSAMVGLTVVVASVISVIAYLNVRSLSTESEALKAETVELRAKSAQLVEQRRRAESATAESLEQLEAVQREIRSATTALAANRAVAEIGTKLSPVLAAAKIDCRGDCASKVKDRFARSELARIDAARIVRLEFDLMSSRDLSMTLQAQLRSERERAREFFATDKVCSSRDSIEGCWKEATAKQHQCAEDRRLALWFFAKELCPISESSADCELKLRTLLINADQFKDAASLCPSAQDASACFKELAGLAQELRRLQMDQQKRLDETRRGKEEQLQDKGKGRTLPEKAPIPRTGD